MLNNSAEKYFLTTYRKPKLHHFIRTTSLTVLAVSENVILSNTSMCSSVP